MEVKPICFPIFFLIPHTPEMKDYYGKNDVYEFNYKDLQSPEQSKQQPVARPKSMVTGKEEGSIDWGVNWEDNAGGAHITGKQDINFKEMNEGEVDATLKFRDVFYFYLPRICNHCVNPVSIKPGETQLTVIPRVATSFESERVSPT